MANRKKEISLSEISEDANQIYQRLLSMEKKIMTELEQLVQDKEELNQEIRNMCDILPDINQLQLSVQDLQKLLVSTSGLAEQVCSRVRRSDLARASASECLARINDMLDLRACRFGVRKAMITEDFESAAVHIKRFLQMDEHEMHKTIDIIKSRPNFDKIPEKKEIDRQSMMDSCRDMRQAKQDLMKLLQVRLARAVQDDDVKMIERYFKLFPLINEHLDGLERYAQYLSMKVLSPSLMEKFARIDMGQADKLAALYENIAKIIDTNQPFVETFYGPGHLLVLIRAMQDECDKHSRRILEEFRNASRLQKLAKFVLQSQQFPKNLQKSPSNSNIQNSSAMHSHNSSAVAGTATSQKLDPREIDKVLNDVCQIISRSEIYLNFLTERGREDIYAGFEDQREREEKLLELYHTISSECDLSHLIQEVSSVYVMMEQYFMHESAHKAIAMDQLDTQTVEDDAVPITSSMLDDVFFIVKKCTKRAVSTRNCDVICAIINHSVTLIESTLGKTLDERLRSNRYFTTSGLSAGSSGTNLDLMQAYNALQTGRYFADSSDTQQRTIYIAAVNNLDRAGSYIDALRSILDSDIQKFLRTSSVLTSPAAAFQPKTLAIKQQHHDREKVANCLNELSAIDNKFQFLVKSALQQFFTSALKPRMRNEIQTLINDNPELLYNLNDNASNSSSQELTNVANTLIQTIDPTLKNLLTERNYETMIAVSRDFTWSCVKKMIR